MPENCTISAGSVHQVDLPLIRFWVSSIRFVEIGDCTVWLGIVGEPALAASLNYRSAPVYAIAGQSPWWRSPVSRAPIVPKFVRLD